MKHPHADVGFTTITVGVLLSRSHQDSSATFMAWVGVFSCGACRAHTREIGQAMALASDTAGEAVRTGSFQYMTESSKHSLYRNDEVLTRRDRDGSDPHWESIELEARQMPVHDSRRLSPAPVCYVKPVVHRVFPSRRARKSKSIPSSACGRQ